MLSVLVGDTAVTPQPNSHSRDPNQLGLLDPYTRKMMIRNLWAPSK